jgi:hypothetical protein
MSLKSFGKQDIQFLVAVDEDDPALGAYKELGIKLTITPRWGYAYMDEYCNRLAQEATGDWLLNWNDDAYMETTNLEELVADLDPDKPTVVLFGGDTRFPMISRGLYKLLGHFAGGPSVDSYIHAIGVHANIIADKQAIEMRHDRDVFSDQTTFDKDFGLMDERMASDEVVQQRLSDIKKVLEEKQ